MTSPVLNVPAYKVFLKQISSAARIINNESQQLNCWNLQFISKFVSLETNELEHLNVTVSNVWIQGAVVYVDEDNLIVDDQTGTAWVTGISKLPQSNKKFDIDNYVMILGHIVNAGSLPLPGAITIACSTTICAKLKAIKVTEISNNLNCRKEEWNSEVLDAQRAYILSCNLKK